MPITFTIVTPDNPDFLCPIELSRQGEFVTLAALPEARPLAEDFIMRFECHPFSRAAITYLRCGIIAQFGMAGRVQNKAVHIIYKFSGSSVSPTQRTDAPEIVRLTRRSASKLRNLTRYPLNGEGVVFPLFAVIEQGSVAAIAADNNLPIAHKTNDIDVEVATAYRKRGYGYAVAAALCRYMMERGTVPAGVVAEHNIASRRLMNALGMRETGRHFGLFIEIPR